MKTLFLLALVTCLPMQLWAAQSWREITMPTMAEAAAAFPQPPMEYRAVHRAIWGGPQSKEGILADIERIHANGGGVYMIINSRGVQPGYLSPDYMDLVKTVVQECKQRGMKVWIECDCGFPDGFAGGLISKTPSAQTQAASRTRPDSICTHQSSSRTDLGFGLHRLAAISYAFH